MFSFKNYLLFIELTFSLGSALEIKEIILHLSCPGIFAESSDTSENPWTRKPIDYTLISKLRS